MVAQAWEVPSLKEELDRKTLETLERLDGQLHRGEIDNAQFVTALDAINGCTLGLVGNDISRCISDELAERRQPVVRWQVFARKDRLKLIRLEQGNDSLCVFSARVSELKVQSNSYEDVESPVQAAFDSFTHLGVALEQRGWKKA